MSSSSFLCNNLKLSRLVLWYLVFGAFHEATHILVAHITGLSKGFFDDGAFPVLYRTLIGRICIIPALAISTNSPWRVTAIRHAAWIASVAIAGIAHFLNRRKRQNSSCPAFLIAAYITALEALSTDLLGLRVLPGLSNANDWSVTRSSSTLFCGNFGIILLHHAWLTRNGEQLALDILEKMVSVTMMRGAQSGGVVTFSPRKNDLVGIRSRVLNGKRTDLSKAVRAKVQKDVFSKFRGRPCIDNFVPSFCGHTRFATSSKASFEGTHPQRWTPPSCRRMYDFSVLRNEKHPFKEPGLVCVETYITHNGDFDFYETNGKSYDLETVQKWLQIVTGQPMPATVDSCAIAGVVDLIRTQGCFGLSARYAICFGLSTSKMEDNADVAKFPSYAHFERVGLVFEEVLYEMLKTASFEIISERNDIRHSFALRVLTRLETQYDVLVHPFAHYLTDQEDGASLLAFVIATVDAFFDNDLLNTAKIFLKNAKGSFGLCITSSLDAHRQICLAARGQTISIAFYPTKGLICYGSEQAAVKAGMNDRIFPTHLDVLEKSHLDVDHDTLRLDLDDLGGEVCLIDWGRCKYKTPAVSKPNSTLVQHRMMNGNVDIFLLQESKATTQDPQLYHRMTRLTRNRFIKPLQEEKDDLVLSDIRDIPKVCQAIQDDWRSDKKDISLNRLTAWNLSRCLRKRLEAHVAGAVDKQAVDILLTGCEVSLWLAEQFASDLQKAFPKLRIIAVSSNKLIGLYGQEIAVPAINFPYSPNTHKLDDTITIIVSHSGGTFASLACSSLFQSTTHNLFVVTSEWDTQIGKQLRNLNKQDDRIMDLFNSRIFTTEVGMRPAEPCSISVAATHQLLTNILEYIAVIVLSDHRFRKATGAVITEQDLLIIEKCNRMNTGALSDIVGVDTDGEPLLDEDCRTEKRLRKAGDLWADHILENAKAYIMTFIYIFGTVISGYPLIYAIAFGAGFNPSKNLLYLIRACDAAIYFWLPQINIIILRLLQRRNLLHRMVGRTVVIGDIPWVAQSAEAFLSKIFAVSYSIAGLNVLSGNPTDHFVHRHTHRVVRGSLVLCGRPDGRLSALSTSETVVSLSVNQASSIQSLGGTCESVTIGHNPFKLPLSANGIFLPRNRPLFLCERMLAETDVNQERARASNARRVLAEERTIDHPTNGDHATLKRSVAMKSLTTSFRTKVGNSMTNVAAIIRRKSFANMLDASMHSLGASLCGSKDGSVRPRLLKLRSSVALLGAYMNLEKTLNSKPPEEELSNEHISVEEVVETAIQERKWSDKAENLFKLLDIDGNRLLSKDEFVEGYHILKPDLSKKQLVTIFEDCDKDCSNALDFHEFLHVLRRPEIENAVTLPPSNRDSRGIIQVEATDERYFGETTRKINAGKEKKTFDFMLARSQHFSQELYETRMASLQRFVAMTVMFHQMGSRVESFFRRISFGLLGYRMDRTHSIMRIATTASPVSGADIRQRMKTLQLLNIVHHSIHVISAAWLHYKKQKEIQRVFDLEHQVSMKHSKGNDHYSR